MFAGLLSKQQPISAWGDVEQIMESLAPFSQDKPRDYWANDSQMLLQVASRNGSTNAIIYRHPESDVAVLFWGRLDNRQDLIHQLVADSKALDDELIALAWLKWGEHCPEKLIGDFALAICCPREKILLLARDVMGVKPLLYRWDENGLFFANTLAAFKPLRVGTLTPSRRWMAKFLADVSHSLTDTAYDEVKKLPPAHSLLLRDGSSPKLRRYHNFDTQSNVANRSELSYLDAYRSLWQESVACRMPEFGNVGCENSGGLDSGSITAEAARQLGTQVNRLHGMGFCYEALEPEYIMATAKRWKIKHTVLFSHHSSATDSERILQRVIRINGAPQEDSNGYVHFPFYEYCQKNDIQHLLSGFGGDELVTYPGGIPARLELMDQRNWRELWRILPGSLPKRVGRLAKTIYTSWRMPEKNMAFLRSWQAAWPNHFLHAEALAEFAVEQSYFATATYDERFRKVNDAVSYLVGRPYASTRLENGTLMAASYGIDYAWPLLDQRIIQQYLHTPVNWKVGTNGMGRFLHRSAVAGVCPDLVTWKPNKDMGISAGVAIAESSDNRSLFKRVIDLTYEIPTALDGIFDAKRIRALAERAQREDWRGLDIQSTWSTNANQLASLKAWLSSD